MVVRGRRDVLQLFRRQMNGERQRSTVWPFNSNVIHHLWQLSIMAHINKSFPSIFVRAGVILLWDALTVEMWSWIYREILTSYTVGLNILCCDVFKHKTLPQTSTYRQSSSYIIIVHTVNTCDIAQLLQFPNSRNRFAHYNYKCRYHLTLLYCSYPHS